MPPPGLLAPSGKQFSLHKLMAMSTMMSPTHNVAHAGQFRPVVQAGGGDALSDIPLQQLYLSHEIQEHLRRVYDSLRGKDELLSRDKLSGWLTTVQQHTIERLENEQYSFEQLLEALYHSAGLEALRHVEPDEKDTSRPISNYYISSSHNTYLMGNQLSSKSSTEAYKNVLIRGCRCIEIDVHNGEPPESKSPDPVQGDSLVTSPTKSEHKRHLSGSTLSSRAAAALERASEKYASTKMKFFSEKEREEETGNGKDKENVTALPATEERGRSSNKDTLQTGQILERPVSVRSMRNGEPLVLHGWTLTAPIGFRAVCKSIGETAFLTSNLPLIISLEVHADMEQQEKMVDIMMEEWKGMLVDEAHESCNPKERLPLLNELHNKILIKVKKAALDKQLSPANTRSDADSYHSDSDDEKAIKKRAKICEKLSNLGIYTHSEHFRSFDTASAKTPPHIFSIGENQIMDLPSDRKSDMFAHNRNFFMRAYPAGFRIDSSNLDPSVFWRKGVQMVALNWQKLDEGMMLNEGMFAGEHGWVLKPPGYRSDSSEPVTFKTLNLDITVYAGQHIPLPSGQPARGLHPYIKCELHIEKPEDSISPDDKPKTRESRAKEGDYKEKTPCGKGDHPDFGKDGCPLQFHGIPQVVEELSFVRYVEPSFLELNPLPACTRCRLS
ncbi:PLC-like phosphodiesterase [Amylocarpus encephaloides]|uniref:Phosphoinositide phospholipase C n=1 Tax=Amylocarpus encephaloides TaxID=45428 RepID=A0A9P7YEE9_9HELO|nr:PLC-like phosphodiesterase [Amylocarpus encephaloides]